MPALATLYELIADDLEQVCRIFDDELFSDMPVVNGMCDHVRLYRGKLLRPALLLLSARACGNVTPEHLTLAAVVEMVHMATLVHDDVLDDADLRRRFPTINRLEGNEAAVLLGDYLISHAFHLCCSLDSPHAAREIGATTNSVCEGELQQICHRGDFDLSVEQYLQIITRKTASLTSACCSLGARYAGADAAAISALSHYGLSVGIAFQIIDDVLDIVGSEDQMGKTLGRDLDKNKPTLPVIHCLSNGDGSEVRALLRDRTRHRSRLRALLDAAGSIDFARACARQHVASALAALDDLPSSDARDTLRRMASLIVDRED